MVKVAKKTGEDEGEKPRLRIAGSHRTVSISEIVPNTYNYNEQTDFIFEKTKKSILEFGFVDPIITRKVGGKNEIIGGEHRLSAAKELGYKELPIIDMGTVPDSTAKKLCIVLNETKGKPNTDSLAQLIAELDKDKDSDLDVLPYTSDELEAFVNMTELKFDTGDTGGDVPEDVDHGTKLKDNAINAMVGFDSMIPEERQKFLKTLNEFVGLEEVENGKVWKNYLNYMKAKLRKANAE